MYCLVLVREIVKLLYLILLKLKHVRQKATYICNDLYVKRNKQNRSIQGDFSSRQLYLSFGFPPEPTL